MSRIDVSISKNGIERSYREVVRGYSTLAAGLAVTRAIGSDQLFGRYVITHEVSGLRIPFVFKYLADAQAAARAIAPLTDWTRSQAEILADTEVRRTAHERLSAFGLQLHTGEVTT